MLPTWIGVLYLLTAVGGMVTGDILDMYRQASACWLLCAACPSRTVFVDAALSLAASLYVLLVAKNVVGTFEAFPLLVAGVLAPWTAIFLGDSRRWHREGYPGQEKERRWHWQACIAWLVGTAVSVAFTSAGVSPGLWRWACPGVVAGLHSRVLCDPRAVRRDERLSRRRRTQARAARAAG